MLAEPLELACGLVLKNRLVKAAMSDSLGDGAGGPTEEQVKLYRRWANGGAALSLIGEVQVDHRFPEKPGNLVLGPQAVEESLRRLADAGNINDAHIWPQLGHAGALAHVPISQPAGPSELDIDGLRCEALSRDAIAALPSLYAQAAAQSQRVGFSGAQIHAGHGFLLSQFLSPLFNHRTDDYGGPIEARCKLVVDIVRAVRREVGSEFAIAVKINSSDQLEGGLSEADALAAIALLSDEAVDAIEISGGTYFPGAPSSSDRRSGGPYFLDFAKRARAVTSIPLMVTGGFKSQHEAIDAVASGTADLVGLARTMVLDAELPSKWLSSVEEDPQFPEFESPPEGGITAWYTMRLTALALGTEKELALSVAESLDAYERRDAERLDTWRNRFGATSERQA